MLLVGCDWQYTVLAAGSEAILRFQSIDSIVNGSGRSDMISIDRRLTAPSIDGGWRSLRLCGGRLGVRSVDGRGVSGVWRDVSSCDSALEANRCPWAGPADR